MLNNYWDVWRNILKEWAKWYIHFNALSNNQINYGTSVGSINIGVDGVVTVIYNDESGSVLRGKSLELTPNADGAINWACKATGISKYVKGCTE